MDSRDDRECFKIFWGKNGTKKQKPLKLSTCSYVKNNMYGRDDRECFKIFWGKIGTKKQKPLKCASCSYVKKK